MTKRTRPSKEAILAAFIRIAKQIGKTPGERTFVDLSGIKRDDIRYYWPRPAALAADAGLAPNLLTVQTPISTLFENLGEISLHIKKIPTKNELEIACRELSKGSATTYIKRFDNSMPTLRAQFKAWLTESPSSKYHQLLTFEGWDVRSLRTVPATIAVQDRRLEYPFLPIALQELCTLATGSKTDKNIAALFEERCANAFQCLGFTIKRFGQGHRAADFLAYSVRDRFALIVDAKSRINGYRLGTDDRQYREYAEQHCSELEHEAVERFYFVVVSSDFNSDDQKRLKVTLKETRIKEISWFTAKGIAEVVAYSIEYRSSFTLKKFENLLLSHPLVGNGIQKFLMKA